MFLAQLIKSARINAGFALPGTEHASAWPDIKRFRKSNQSWRGQVTNMLSPSKK